MALDKLTVNMVTGNVLNELRAAFAEDRAYTKAEIRSKYIDCINRIRLDLSAKEEEKEMCRVTVKCRHGRPVPGCESFMCRAPIEEFCGHGRSCRGCQYAGCVYAKEDSRGMIYRPCKERGSRT
jgi:hypothetical protein